jgi:hypothetical protein
MGLRSHALAFAAGAAMTLYVLPESNKAISEKVSSAGSSVSGLLSRLKSSIRPLQQPVAKDSGFLGSSPLRPLQQPYLFSDETKPSLERPDGTTMESWNYQGNIWPSNWPITNPDGSYNHDYIRWYQGRNR